MIYFCISLLFIFFNSSHSSQIPISQTKIETKKSYQEQGNDAKKAFFILSIMIGGLSFGAQKLLKKPDQNTHKLWYHLLYNGLPLATIISPLVIKVVGDQDKHYYIPEIFFATCILSRCINSTYNYHWLKFFLQYHGENICYEFYLIGILCHSIYSNHIKQKKIIEEPLLKETIFEETESFTNHIDNIYKQTSGYNKNEVKRKVIQWYCQEDCTLIDHINYLNATILDRVEENEQEENKQKAIEKYHQLLNAAFLDSPYTS